VVRLFNECDRLFIWAQVSDQSSQQNHRQNKPRQRRQAPLELCVRISDFQHTNYICDLLPITVSPAPCL